jgi:hypothetical protein
MKKNGGINKVEGTLSTNSEAHFKTAIASSIFLNVTQRRIIEIPAAPQEI